MALASVLSIQLSVEPEGKGLNELCEQINSNIRDGFTSPSTFQLILAVLRFVASDPTQGNHTIIWEYFQRVYPIVYPPRA
jgi:hypothetical protein